MIIATLIFTLGCLAALALAWYFQHRDRGTHADEKPKTPYQKDDMEDESKRRAR